MNIYLKNFLVMLRKSIATNQRICDICGAKETINNIMLKYDNGKIMCDDCAIKTYGKEEK